MDLWGWGGLLLPLKLPFPGPLEGLLLLWWAPKCGCFPSFYPSPSHLWLQWPLLDPQLLAKCL